VCQSHLLVQARKAVPPRCMRTQRHAGRRWQQVRSVYRVGAWQECDLTPPSSGRLTAPLMSNVSRHMQPSWANGSAVKHSFVLRACAAWRSAVGSRKSQLAQPLCRAVRPAAAGAPVVKASPEQTPASCRAVRPSAASAPVRAREQEFGGLRGHGQESSTRRATTPALRPGPASTQRLRRFVLRPWPASAVRPMPAAVSVASVACKCRKRCAVATVVLSASKTP
jgi:hypothetical protein